MKIIPLSDTDRSAQAELTRALAEASAVYYGSGRTVMTDRMFDEKLEQLRALERESGFAYENSPTVAVGADVVTALEKDVHEQSALSLDKVKYADREELTGWLSGRDGLLSWKMDGLTVIVTYDGGRLTKAVTRGNGTEGSVITHNARFFSGLPMTIPYSGHLVVRGECTMSNAEFERVNTLAGGIYENARNLASATIQMLDSGESRKRKIDFTAFKLVVPEPGPLAAAAPADGAAGSSAADAATTDGTAGSSAADAATLSGTSAYADASAAAAPADGAADLSTESGRFAWMNAQGFRVVRHEPVTADSILRAIENWKADIPDNPFPTDGLVLSYNDQVYAEGLGATGHHPRGSIAMKWTDELALTTIREIEWSVGKTGVITPVAIFDTVRLGLGSNVSRASLHNISIMKHMPSMGPSGASAPDQADAADPETTAPPAVSGDAESAGASVSSGADTLNSVSGTPTDTEKAGGSDASSSSEAPCGIGSRAMVYMANMIIPQIHSCTPGRIDIPAVCPVCGHPTELKENAGIETLHCTNPDCSARHIKRIAAFAGKSGVNIDGLSETRIEYLVSEGYIRNEADFYTLKDRPEAVEKLSAADGWGEKSVSNLLAAIEASRNTTLQQFLTGLSIPLVGHDLASRLSLFFSGDINAFLAFVQNPDEDALSARDGFGPVKAKNIVQWCRNVTGDPDQWDAFSALLHELSFPRPEPGTPPGSTASGSDALGADLTGLTFVITGNVHDYKNRDEFRDSVERRGGKVAGSVSKKTFCLVNNDVDSTSGKNKKAKELGIPIISEDEFIARYGR